VVVTADGCAILTLLDGDAVRVKKAFAVSD
jgi:hypothetical protein